MTPTVSCSTLDYRRNCTEEVLQFAERPPCISRQVFGVIASNCRLGAHRILTLSSGSRFRCRCHLLARRMRPQVKRRSAVGFWMSMNCTPKPCGWCRTTRARSLPSRTSVPRLGPRRGGDGRAGDGDVEHAAGRARCLRPDAASDSPLLGVMRSWRRLASSSSSLRLASQVSCAASFSRLWCGRVDLEGEAARRTRARPRPRCRRRDRSRRRCARRRARTTADDTAAPPTEMSISLQGCSSLLSRMNRPSSVTAMRLWRRRSGTIRDRTPCGAAGESVMCLRACRSAETRVAIAAGLDAPDRSGAWPRLTSGLWASSPGLI